jgi:serine/threonine protein kinase/tetratricopeptide (TPR) repeat protein
LRCPKCRFDNPQDTKFCSNCAAPLPHPDELQAASTATLMSPAIRELSAGSTFARRYQVIEDLGHGGMGRVYKVFDTEVREKLALKLLNPEIASDEQTIERFRNELKLARTISHRNICRMHDLGHEEDTYYITMEYISGEDLKSFIHRVGALPVGKAVSIARQVCEGLAEAHRVGVVHRDLKPQNIMIDRDGNARIMDFGIARSVKAKGITGANVMIGTPEYMSPEQVDGKEADRRSDIYSLGIVLFEMLTGRLPFEGDTPLAVAVKQKSEPAPDPRKINPQIPEDLKQVVWKCLDKAREKRYQRADELSADLAKIEKSLPTTTQPLPIRRPSTSRQITVRLPSKRIWIPAVIALAAVIAFVVWQLIPQRESAKRSIAIMGFRNQTGDKAFDYLQETIPNLLITSLEQSGHFRVTSWQQLKDLFRQSGRDETALLDEETGFEICRKEGIEALVVGFYTKAGETFVTDVKVLDAPTKQPLKTAQARGEGPASILKTQIDDISRSISRGIGLPALKLEKSQPKIVDLTTNSLEAYNYFLKGRDELERFYSADARRSLEKAVELDPGFAVAYLYLSNAYSELADAKAMVEALEKARRFAGKATEKERLYIEARYAWLVERNPDRRYRLLRELTEKFPAEKYAHFELANLYDNQKRYPEAIAEYEKALALDPNFGYAMNSIAYVHAKLGDFDKAIRYLESYAAVNPGDPNPMDSIAEIYMRMGKLDDSVAKYRALLAAKPDFYLSYASLAYVYALKEDYDQADRALAECIARAPSPSAKAEAQWNQAFLGYLEGRWDESLAAFLALKRQAEQTGGEPFLARVNWITGFIYCDRGEFEAARRAFQAFVASGIERNPSNRTFFAAAQDFFNGWVDLRQDRLEAARTDLQNIQRLLPDVDPVNREQATFLIQLLEAEIALARNSLDEAVVLAEKIKLGSFPNTRTQSMANYNTPFLKDVLARTCWKKGQLDKAAAEYRKLMTIDPANQVRYIIHPLYHYRLGRVLEEKGDKEGARLQYQRFIDCWKDADASHPELADARKRLAALR